MSDLLHYPGEEYTPKYSHAIYRCEVCHRLWEYAFRYYLDYSVFISRSGHLGQIKLSVHYDE